MGSHLDKLAKQHGISLTRTSPDNAEVSIADETKRQVLAALGVEEKSAVTPLKQKPSKAIPKSYLPEALEQGMAQLAAALADDEGRPVNAFRPRTDIRVTTADGAGHQPRIKGKVVVRAHVNYHWRVRRSDNSAQLVGGNLKI